MLKLSENPPTLFPAVGSVRELTGQWWVVHTKARSEKALAWDLLNRDIAYFLPLVKRTTFSGSRRRHGMVALFPSYLFVSGDALDHDAVVRSDRVANVIAVDDQRQLLDELSSLERVLSGPVQLDLCPFAIVGTRVRIARGPFCGIVGRVVRRDNVTRLVLEISILGRGAEMDIEADLLEAVG
jgi:transcription antitermination factor NusG